MLLRNVSARWLLPALLLLGAPHFAQAQTGGVGIGTTTPDVSAALDIVSSSKGALLPRVADATALATPATGLLVFQTNAPAGFYYNAGTPAAPSWQQIATAAGAAVTASNGLTKTGQNLALGGPLTRATDVPLAGNNLTFSGSNGNVGIGNASPQRLLDLGSTSYPRPAFLRLGAGSGGSFRQWELGMNVNPADLNDVAGDNYDFSLRDVGSNATRLLVEWNTGNVGIGTSSPTAKLDVAGNANVAGSATVGGDATVTGNLGVGTSGGFVSRLSFGTAANYNVPAGRLALYEGSRNFYGLGLVQNMASPSFFGLGLWGGTPGGMAAANAPYDGTAGVLPHLYLDRGTGNVGVGTIGPGQKLEVAGQVYSSSGGFRFPDNTVQTTAATTATGANFIQNTTTPQAASNFNVSGNGTVGGTLTAANAVVSTALTGNGANLGTAVGLGIRADGGLNLGQNTAGNNFFLGYQNGQANTTGTQNQFIGFQAGVANTTGISNEFTGLQSGQANSSGSYNHFDGHGAGLAHQTGDANVFTGYLSGFSGTTGSYNVFAGAFSGRNTEGSYNVFTGYLSGAGNTTGSNNTALGHNSGPATGSGALTNATALGANARVTQSNTVVLGNNANVGIGTSAPGQKLEVAGGIKFTGTGSVLTFPDGSTQATAAAPNLTGDVTSTGAATTYNNVVPATKGGAGTVSGLLKANGAGLVSAAVAGTDYAAASGSAAYIQNTTTPQVGADFNVSGSGTVGGTLTAANVGIGISAPAGGLHVLTGNGGVTSGTGAILNGPPSGNPNLELRGGATAVSPFIDLAETSNVDFSSRLISQGGTLNVFAANATALKVNGNATVTGTLTVNTTVYTSDARFKTHVRPIGAALAAVLALRGVRYEWNALGVAHGGTAGAPQVGLLAQELEKVYPELVSTDAQGYKAVNYAQLTPVLIEALKEQQTQLEALKARAATAEAKATALETAAAQAAADHARLLTLQAQVAHLLGEGTQASVAPRK